MQNTLFRTARSGVLNTAHDFSCVVLTADCRLLAAAESLPIHIMIGPDLMCRAVLRHHPDLKRGDAFLHNSPYEGNSHAADHCLIVPVIDDDERAALLHAGQGASGRLRQRAADHLHGPRPRRVRGRRADLPGGQGPGGLPQHRGHHPDLPDAHPRARAVVGRLSGRARRGADRRARDAGAWPRGRLGHARAAMPRTGSTTPSSG